MDIIQYYENSLVERVPLRELVSAFKGRAVSSKAESGEIAVINLSDMTEDGIIYDNLKTFSEDKERLSRYLLEDGDVLIASKGTVKKVAVFDKQDRDVVASSNITVLRPGEMIRGYYIKFFLDTELGQALLDRTDNGKAVLNLSTQAILNITVPLIPLIKQDYHIANYKRAKADYDRKLARAEQEWLSAKEKVAKALFNEL